MHPPGLRGTFLSVRAASVLLLVALLALAGGCSRPAGAPNVLLISIDSLRADRLGAWGNPRATSPTLDRLAAEGVRFAEAVSPTSWTLPAHVSLLTGLPQRRHLVINVSNTIPADIPVLPELFAAHGYATVGFYSGPFLHPSYGFGRGFEHYVSCQGPETDALRGAFAWESSHKYRTNPRVLRAWKRWVAHEAREPFFAFVHMWDVHYDYIPPEPYRSMFDPTYAGRLDGRDIVRAGFPLDASARDVAHLLALYDGEIRYTDATIARMLGLLDRAGLLDHTIVVVTADHGDEFLEHGGKGHQRTLFEEVVHVPLIIWARDGLPRGRTVTRPVSLEDVAPTILALAGLPGMPGAEGRSLVPLFAGAGTAGAGPPVTSALYNIGRRLLLLGSIRSGPTKLVYDERTHTTVRYDLAADPGERAPMPSTGGPLEAALQARVRETLTVLALLPGGRAAPPAALPPGEVERLRMLGYIE
jgi:choline-sulfatase